MSTIEHHVDTLENIDSTETVLSECSSTVNVQEIEHSTRNGISSLRPDPEGCSVSEKGNQLCQSDDSERADQVPNDNHVFADNANNDICVDKKVSRRSNSSSHEDNAEIMYSAAVNGDCLTQCEDRTKLQVDTISTDVLPVTIATASAQSNIVNTAMTFISSTAHSLSPNVFQGTLLHAVPSVPMQIYDPSSGHVGPCRHPHLAHQHCVVSPHHYYHHDSAAAVTPPPPLLSMGTSTPSANTVPQVNGNSSGAAAHHQHVVHVHINPGEKLTIRVEDQYQNIDGPATVRMVSNNGPPLPMPMQVPPGHMVQQIVDENGILTHVILSPQPPGMMRGTMSGGGPANSPQYYAPYRGHYPQYPSPHPHSHHGNTSPTTQVSSPQINSMDEQVNARQQDQMRKRLQENENFGNRGLHQTNKKRGTNGVDSHISANIINTPCHSPEEIGEDRGAIQSQLSKMPKTHVNCGPLCIVQVDDIEARSVLIHLLPPEWDTTKYDLDTSELCYELLLGDKGPDSKYKLVYIGDATEIMLKDLKPATEYHLKVCAILDDIRGSETKPISFKTVPCEPDQPQSPKLYQKSKTTLYLKWVNPCENGSKICTYIVEYNNGDGSENFVEVYNGLQRQHRLSKLKPSTKYMFRLAAVNGIGKSAYSDPVVFCTSGLVPLQPNPPMLCESRVKELLLSWIKGPFDDEFTLQLDDGVSGHGFLTVYNGPLLSYRITNLTRNKEYKFRLCTKNEEGTSKWSEVVQYKTLPARPDCPSKPQIKGKIQPHSFRIIWDPPKDDGGAEISKYVVELDDGNGSETVFEGAEREHLCDGLVPGHTYRVRVAACNNGGRSDFSEVCKVITQAVPPGQCQAPKLQGKPKATSLHLRWAYPDSTGGSSITEFAAQMILPDNTCQEVYRGHELDCLVADLSPGRPYLFQVQAFNCTGAGPWSEPLEVVSGAGVPDPPKLPQLTCRSAHSAVVSWEEPVNNGATITEYRLEWQLQSDKDFTQLYFGPCKSYEVKGLSAATSYAFRVQAINSAGLGLYSPAAICYTPASSPSTVVSIRASPTATSVHLSWKAPRDNGSEIYAYNIDILDKQLLCVGALTEYTVEELSPEMTYKVRIQAQNGVGVGAFSSIVKFTTNALPPSPPKLECCGTTHNSVKLKWGEGRNVDLITFTLEMVQEDGSSNYQEVYKGQSYACKINRLSEMTTYHFRIQASNDAGSGPYSDTYTCLTTKAPPPALKAPKVEDIALTSCNIEWQGCRPMGGDKILYILQLQSGDHEYRQIYKGPDSSFHLDDLQCRAEYLVRVCAIRWCSDDLEIIGAFSPGSSFTTASPEPIKALVSPITESKYLERKQLTDQQLAAVFLVAFFTVAVLIAVIIQHI